MNSDTPIEWSCSLVIATAILLLGASCLGPWAVDIVKDMGQHWSTPSPDAEE